MYIYLAGLFTFHTMRTRNPVIKLLIGSHNYTLSGETLKGDDVAYTN